MNDLLKKVLQNKLDAEDKVYKWSITPTIDVFNNAGVIDEARECLYYNGIPIASFADTSDKFVLTLKHFGYNFKYPPGEGFWANGYYSDESIDISQVNEQLYQVGMELAKKYKVWYVRINMTSMGDDYSKAVILDEDTDEDADSLAHGCRCVITDEDTDEDADEDFEDFIRKNGKVLDYYYKEGECFDGDIVLFVFGISKDDMEVLCK